MDTRNRIEAKYPQQNSLQFVQHTLGHFSLDFFLFSMDEVARMDTNETKVMAVTNL